MYGSRYLLALAAVLSQFVVTGCGEGRISGAELFSLHCAACHPDGGNTINPEKTLHSAGLRANNIRSAEDIVEKMRNPGAGMPKFSQAVIPDREARLIAEHVLAAFR